jgi:exopolysaccharide biosynthesis polyprenyl glycosylphosphotransferase
LFAGEQRKQKAIFAIVDACAILVAYRIALAIHDPHRLITTWLHHSNLPLVAAATLAVVFMWLLVFDFCDLYRLRNGGSSELLRIAKACAIATVLSLVLEYAAHLFLPRLLVATGFLLSIGLVAVGRGFTRNLIQWFYSDPNITIPLAVVGFTPIAYFLCDRLLEDLSQYEFLGFLDDHAQANSAYRGFPVLGGINSLEAMRTAHPGLEVIIAQSDTPVENYRHVIEICEASHVRWRMVPPLLHLVPGALCLDFVGGIPLVGSKSCNIEGLNYILKRAFDIAVAGLALAIALPLMALVGGAVLLFDGRPVLFRQRRIGIRGETFELLKFRTMHPGTDTIHRQYVREWIETNGAEKPIARGNGKVFKLVDDPRITGIGRILRQFCLDELPQLFNVLRGEMSLVGPRPALPYEIELYQNWHKRRLEALPGITGLWQVAGRNLIGFDDMVRLDIEYLDGWSLTEDLLILLRTVPVILHGSGH